MREHKFTILNSRQERLVGLEDSPDKIRGKLPAVILAHGFAGNKDERGMFAELARALVEQNMIVYRFDLSGCGESEGDYSHTTLTKLADDVRAVINYVKTRPRVDAECLGLIGFSFGTTTVLALQPPEARCLVLMGAVAHPQKVTAQLFGNDFNPLGVSHRVSALGARIAIYPEFWNDLERYDCIEIVRHWDVPILVVHNQEDNVVPVRESEAIYDAAKGVKDKFIVSDAGHAIRDYPTLLMVAKWCNERLSVKTKNSKRGPAKRHALT